MKKIIVVMLLLLTAPAFADDKRDADCTAYGNLAYNAMGAHQRGVSLSYLLDILKKNATGDKAMDDALRNITIGAFEKPRLNTEEFQEKLKADYRDETMLACLKATH